MRKLFLVFVAVSLLALLAGCAQPPAVPEAQATVEVAESALCASIKAYEESVAALEAVTAETTVDEVKALDKAADDAYVAMVEAAADLHVAELQAVESAVAGLKDSLTNVPGEATLGDVSTGIQTSATAVQDAVKALDDVACVEPGK